MKPRSFPRRGDVWLVNLGPTMESEIAKSRPALIVSPDELNAHLRTVIVVPLTSTLRPYPFRVDIRFARRRGSLAIDQVRTLDRARLTRRVGALDPMAALAVLREMFSA